jgi:hypothetical protein
MKRRSDGFLTKRRPTRLRDWHVRSYVNCGCATTKVTTAASGHERTFVPTLIGPYTGQAWPAAGAQAIGGLRPADLGAAGRIAGRQVGGDLVSGGAAGASGPLLRVSRAKIEKPETEN